MPHTTARRFKPQARLEPAHWHWWQARKADVLTTTPRVAPNTVTPRVAYNQLLCTNWPHDVLPTKIGSGKTHYKLSPLNVHAKEKMVEDRGGGGGRKWGWEKDGGMGVGVGDGSGVVYELQNNVWWNLKATTSSPLSSPSSSTTAITRTKKKSKTNQPTNQPAKTTPTESSLLTPLNNSDVSQPLTSLNSNVSHQLTSLNTADVS